jgi:hypothetical protein
MDESDRGFLVIATDKQTGDLLDSITLKVTASHDLRVPEPTSVLDLIQYRKDFLSHEKLVPRLRIVQWDSERPFLQANVAAAQNMAMEKARVKLVLALGNRHIRAVLDPEDT